MNQFAPQSCQPVSRLKLEVVNLRTHIEASSGGFACNCPCLCAAEEE